METKRDPGPQAVPIGQHSSEAPIGADAGRDSGGTPPGPPGRPRCTLCPRECGADRTLGQGRCGAGSLPRLARAALHRWEEPCISGVDPRRGSGTVFFSGCPLGCRFCQNHPVSQGTIGKEVPISRLSEIFLELQDQGAWNINLVSATQYIPQVTEALELIKGRLNIPVVWNTGGYEKVEGLRLLEGYVDIYLPDLKFFDPALSDLCADAPDYFAAASAAIPEMLRQTGSIRFGKDGMLRRGVMVRHLILPGQRKDSEQLLRWLAGAVPVEDIYLSLMSQYTPIRPMPLGSPGTPHERAFSGSVVTPGDPEQIVKALNRRVATFEYNWVREIAEELGFSGYGQDRTSAREEYTPPFDLTGV